MGQDLVNYDDDDDDMNIPPVIAVSSSPEAPTAPSITSNRPRTMTDFPRVHRTPQKIRPRKAPYPIPTTTTTRAITPPLAMIDTYVDHPYSPVSSYALSSPPVPSELSLTERNLVVMAIQEHVDWGLIAAQTGVPVEKLLKWWMRTSSGTINQG
jgi:hypothetical protein